MEKIINIENLRQFAYVNHKICKKPIKGIVLSFFGLGNPSMFSNEIAEGEFYGEQGILYVVPYTNPWSWMNQQSIELVDEIIDVIINYYELSENIAIVSSGGSMGGQSAIVYMAYAKRTPIACVANCPVCDMVYHYNERKDLPRTLYSAFFNEQGSLIDILKKYSPLHLMDKLPKVKYHLFHCNNDKEVNIQAHSSTFVEKMKINHFDITYDVVLDRGHCDLSEEMKKKYVNYIIEEIKNQF